MCDLSADERTVLLDLLDAVAHHAAQVERHAPAVIATNYVHHEELLAQLDKLGAATSAAHAWSSARAARNHVHGEPEAQAS
jgi:hypothetical protein